MHSFIEFLAEGRDAPLYHATSSSKARHIIFDNMLKLSKNYEKIGEKNSISFTRNLKVAWSHAANMHSSVLDAVVFEVDQAMLTHNYKLEPYQFWSQPSRESHSRVNKARLDKADTTEERYNEFEERITSSNVTNFDKYITKVMVYSPNSFALEYDEIKQHPLLYIYTKKTFPNR